MGKNDGYRSEQPQRVEIVISPHYDAPPILRFSTNLRLYRQFRSWNLLYRVTGDKPAIRPAELLP
jgi:hypothetical protein